MIDVFGLVALAQLLHGPQWVLMAKPITHREISIPTLLRALANKARGLNLSMVANKN